MARFLAEHAAEVAFLTVEQLAAAVGVSPATVVRLAVALGYDGYTKMQAEVRDSIRAMIAPPARVMRADVSQDAGQVVSRTLTFHAELLRRAAGLNGHAVLTEVLGALQGAERVLVTGFGSSSTAAFHLARGLEALLPQVSLIEREDLVGAHLARVGPADVLVAFSIPRYSRRTVEIARVAHRRGCRGLAITNSQASPVCPFARWVLICPHEQAATPVASPVAAVALADALLAGLTALLMRGDAEVVLGRLRGVEAVYDDLDTWAPLYLDEGGAGRPGPKG